MTGRPGRARTATVLTHGRPTATADALRTLIAAARGAGATLRFDAEETRKHGLASAEAVLADAPLRRDVDLCVVLGGDGTLLRALRAYVGTGVPIFGVNFGEVGFLATVDPDGLDDAFARAFSGAFEVLELPGVAVTAAAEQWTAINDVSFHRRPGLRVADLAYSVGGEEVGRVRCDGLVVATPAGSTGYNLANGGPVMAWGVEGFVVSFVAPHSLTARPVVVAPEDVLTVTNRSRDEPAEVTVDGRPVCALAAGESLDVRFVHNCGSLAQAPGASFYHRLRQKFGHLASTS